MMVSKPRQGPITTGSAH